MELIKSHNTLFVTPAKTKIQAYFKHLVSLIISQIPASTGITWGWSLVILGLWDFTEPETLTTKKRGTEAPPFLLTHSIIEVATSLWCLAAYLLCLRKFCQF